MAFWSFNAVHLAINTLCSRVKQAGSVKTASSLHYLAILTVDLLYQAIWNHGARVTLRYASNSHFPSLSLFDTREQYTRTNAIRRTFALEGERGARPLISLVIPLVVTIHAVCKPSEVKFVHLSNFLFSQTAIRYFTQFLRHLDWKRRPWRIFGNLLSVFPYFVLMITSSCLIYFRGFIFESYYSASFASNFELPSVVENSDPSG